MSIYYNSITECIGNVQVSEKNTSENGSVYKVSGEKTSKVLLTW
nr:MAG TPA: hypothetical protein [Caudoviricetes sp.]